MSELRMRKDTVTAEHSARSVSMSAYDTAKDSTLQAMLIHNWLRTCVMQTTSQAQDSTVLKF